MKKLVSTTILALCLGSSFHAQSETMTVGYSGGETYYGCPVDYGTGDNDWIEMAIYLPPSTVATLKGNKITGVNGSLNLTGSIKTVRIWLREELEGENLAEFTLVPTQLNNIRKGVNSQKFTTPWVVPDDYEGGLYVGFGHQIKNNDARGLSAIPSPLIDGSLFIRDAKGKWTDHSEKGIACLEAVVEGDHLPETNIKLVNVTTPRYYVNSKHKLNADFLLLNMGSKSVDSFDIRSTYPDGGTSVKTVNCLIGAGMMSTINADIAPEFTLSGEQDITFTIENVNGKSDIDPSDNSMNGLFTAVAKDYKRKVLSEEFSTENCGSCPAVVEQLYLLLSDPKYADVIQVSHHAAFGRDFLTRPWHVEYEWLYGPSGTFAPGLLTDRTVRSVGDAVVYYPYLTTDITREWDIRLNQPALVSLDITARYLDDSRSRIEVTVKGEKSIPELCDHPVINVFLTESRIPAIKQNNGGEGYVHNDVSRAVSSPEYWGEALNFDGDTYSYTCVFDLEDDWKQDDMEIVAYIGNDGINYTDKEVMNAASANLVMAATGVDNVTTDNIVDRVVYYDLNGRIVENPGNGIFIRQTRYIGGEIKTEKQILR